MYKTECIKSDTMAFAKSGHYLAYITAIWRKQKTQMLARYLRF